jgi:hypothetical protein
MPFFEVNGGEDSMVAFITFEGVKVKAKVISKKKIVSSWKMLTEKPFPKVKAFLLRDGDFDHIVESSKTRDDERRERQEWGRVLSPKGTDAFVCNVDESGDVEYLILIRENLYHDLVEVLKHELFHCPRRPVNAIDMLFPPIFLALTSNSA